ncbi:hypothetical protein Tco_0643803 [Tanacetum coccineum]
MSLQELISYMPPSIAETANRHMQCLDEMQFEIDSLMMNLGTFILEPLVNYVVYKDSDDDIKVTLDKEQILSDHYTAHVTPHTYTPSLPFLATMEPTDTLLMGDEVISTIPERKNNEFIKFSVDDLVPIPRESKVTSVYSNLKCDMPVNTPLPTTDVREEDFDINSPLGEQVVDFLMENEDVAGLPRHLEFEDISSLDPPKLAPLNYEPLGNSDSMSRSIETSDLILEELNAEIGLDSSSAKHS